MHEARPRARSSPGRDFHLESEAAGPHRAEPAGRAATRSNRAHGAPTRVDAS